MSNETITCPSCGTSMPAATRFCPVCGHANEAAAAPTSPNGQATTAFNTPMAPPAFGTASETPLQAEERARASAPAGETVNFGTQSAPAGQSTQYFPPRPEQVSQYAPPANSSKPVQQTEQPSSTSLYQYGSQPPAQPPVQAYGPPVNTNYQFQPAPGVAGVPQRDPTVALLLELIGYVWVLGIGHLYAGRINRGIALMVGYWAYWGVVTVLFMSVVGIPVACLMALVHPVVPILSALWVRRDVERDNLMYPQYPQRPY